MNQYPPPPPYARPKSKLPWILGGILAAVFGVILLVVIFAVAIGNNAKSKPGAAPPPSTPSTTTTKSAPAAAAPSTTQSGPLREFGDGIYKVGVDIEAGSYKTEGGKYCFWQRMRDDSGELDAVIANHIGDGPQRVTVKAGEFFEVNRCRWTKA